MPTIAMTALRMWVFRSQTWHNLLVKKNSFNVHEVGRESATVKKTRKVDQSSMKETEIHKVE